MEAACSSEALESTCRTTWIEQSGPRLKAFDLYSGVDQFKAWPYTDYPDKDILTFLIHSTQIMSHVRPRPLSSMSFAIQPLFLPSNPSTPYSLIY
jgi:hypothetical protein